MGRIKIPGKSERLPLEFFARKAEAVARDLLGRVLVVERPRKCPLYARIHEASAYEGEEDSSSKGILYAPGIVGISTKFGKRLLDISTNRQNIPSCVTLIGGDIHDGAGQREFAQGPGNLTKALEIGPEYDGLEITTPPLWIGGNSINPDIIKQRKLSNVPANCKGYFYFRKE